jgi:hypothetical protein
MTIHNSKTYGINKLQIENNETKLTFSINILLNIMNFANEARDANSLGLDITSSASIPYTKKLKIMITVTPWLSYYVDKKNNAGGISDEVSKLQKDKNVYQLIILELWCKSNKINRIKNICPLA